MARIAIYAIAKNEAANVPAFLQSCRGADAVIVLDTGSTDDTVALLRAGGAFVAQKTIDPWRFDVARNDSLALVPDDIDLCLCLDLDERLDGNWRAALDDAWEKGAHRVCYFHVWNFNPDGSPGISYWGDRVHRRHGYHWIRPVHEVVRLIDPTQHEIIGKSNDFRVLHYRDTTKPRHYYLDLLELATRESPNDPRVWHDLGREQVLAGKHEAAIQSYSHFLRMPESDRPAERASAMRGLANSCKTLQRRDEELAWLRRAVAECPTQREPWVQLAQACRERADWPNAFAAAISALKITERPTDYVCQAWAWNHVPHDIAATSAWMIGLRSEALALMESALKLSPNETHLRDNHRIMLEKLKAEQVGKSDTVS